MVGLAPPAVAAADIRTVSKRVALKYTYNPATGITRVTKYRLKTVRAKFVGGKVLEKRHGKWTRIPYVWDRRTKSLVYSRRLHLKLLSKPPVQQAPTTPQETPPPIQQTPPPSPTTPSLEPPPPGDPTVTATNAYTLASGAHHVLNRVGYGVSREGLQDVQDAGGARAWLRQQLRPDTVDDSQCDKWLTRLPDQSEPIWAVTDDIRNDRRSGWRQLMWVNTGMIARAAWSRRQLLASLEEFWGNHFNVTVPSDNQESSRAHYQWTIRHHALGSFEDLLFAVSTHPSMLTYLNNRDSDDEHPNENQGRELLELHTVGLEAGYTEDDVVNSARILTGLSVDNESEEFEYKPWRHWVGPVQVLGFSHPNSSRAGGVEVFRAYARYLAAHPATARRISRKLATWFVSDTPSEDLVASLAGVYARSGGNITALLDNIFDSAEFWASAGDKTRRPFDAYIAAIRRLGITPAASGIDAWEAMTWVLEDMGQAPFGAPYPTGWPDTPLAWTSPMSTLKRWNQMLGIAGGWPDELTRADLTAAIFGVGALPSTYGSAIDTVAQALFGMPLSPGHRQAVLTFLDRTANSAANANSAIYGWRLPYVIALLFDSPYLLSK